MFGRKITRLKTLGAVFVCATTLSSPGDATVYNGHITEVYVSSSASYAFRVYLDSGASGCGSSFLALSPSDTNYQAKAATLLTGYSLGKLASITATADGSGFCVITDLNIQN
jgi:hypothetical protein